MKHTIREYPIGELRTRKAFLFWPKCLKLHSKYGDWKEWRWLESATWVQEHVRSQYDGNYWLDIHWEVT